SKLDRFDRSLASTASKLLHKYSYLRLVLFFGKIAVSRTLERRPDLAGVLRPKLLSLSILSRLDASKPSTSSSTRSSTPTSPLQPVLVDASRSSGRPVDIFEFDVSLHASSCSPRAREASPATPASNPSRAAAVSFNSGRPTLFLSDCPECEADRN
uniref:Uncharacterized protein n=1 Tax=Triticum urartu TaxID=4572 RepID=A0A8R7UTM8_TRIUA